VPGEDGGRSSRGRLFRDLWEDEGERETELTLLHAECEVLSGRPEDYFPY
jgi:hypothetical protein